MVEFSTRLNVPKTYLFEVTTFNICMKMLGYITIFEEPHAVDVKVI
jgi:hypothetical protein